jgi:hypothetical protein
MGHRISQAIDQWPQDRWVLRLNWPGWALPCRRRARSVRPRVHAMRRSAKTPDTGYNSARSQARVVYSPPIT